MGPPGIYLQTIPPLLLVDGGFWSLFEPHVLDVGVTALFHPLAVRRVIVVLIDDRDRGIDSLGDDLRRKVEISLLVIEPVRIGCGERDDGHLLAWAYSV